MVEKNSGDVVKELIMNLGGWPVLEGDYWSEKHFDWEKTVYSFRRAGLQFDYIVDISVGFDLMNSNSRMVQIDQPVLGINREYLVKGLNNKVTRAYYDLMVDIALLLGANPSTTPEEMRKTLNFEISLANVSVTMRTPKRI